MNTINTTKPEKWIREGTTIYCLHETGRFIKGKPEVCNKFYLSVQPDYSRGITNEMAEEQAKMIHAALTIVGTLYEIFN